MYSFTYEYDITVQSFVYAELVDFTFGFYTKDRKTNILNPFIGWLRERLIQTKYQIPKTSSNLFLKKLSFFFFSVPKNETGML